MRYKFQAMSGGWQEFVFTRKSIYYWDNTTFQTTFTPTERVKVNLQGAKFIYLNRPDRIGKFYHFLEFAWPDKPYYENSVNPRAMPKINFQFWQDWTPGEPTVFISHFGPKIHRYPSMDIIPDEYESEFMPFMLKVRDFYASLPEFH